MYLKLTYFLNHNLILFSEKNYQKQAEMFYQNHSLVCVCVCVCVCVGMDGRSRVGGRCISVFMYNICTLVLCLDLGVCI